MNYLPIKSLTCLTLEFLVVSASFLTRSPNALSLHLTLMKVSFFGYASNAHGYHILNKSTSCVDVTCDMTFDESNGSQVEQVDELCVG
jgi:hypothetical protein